ncbi:MAG TPA: hypothetical protein VFY94_07670 [Rhodanobacteraceae bacterium]|nr:hypothetical protein [Rhodanobacteraceae bacterium]
MAHSERTPHARVDGCGGRRKWALVAGMCIALLATQPAPAQTSSQIQQGTADAIYKLNFLTEMAALARDPALQQQLRQQIAEALQELQSLNWQAYRHCEAMRHPTQGNSGDIYKWAEEEKHRNEAMQGLSGISRIFGGVPSQAGAALSAPSDEAVGTAKGIVIDSAEKLAQGTNLSGLVNKLGPALAMLEGGTQLYNAWQAVKAGSDVIDQRNAADAALTDCRKPLNPEQLDQGTPYLRPFPPGPLPVPPKNPPPRQSPNPKQPPQKPIPLGQFLQQMLGASGHGG